MPFCGECKSLVYPKAGKLECRKCGWSDAVTSKVVSNAAETREQVVVEEGFEARQIQDTECPKCGHGRAYFHLMQTRRSDEPPTEINQCMKCEHSWREY